MPVLMFFGSLYDLVSECLLSRSRVRRLLILLTLFLIYLSRLIYEIQLFIRVSAAVSIFRKLHLKVTEKE
jgi:hypothetical protein